MMDKKEILAHLPAEQVISLFLKELSQVKDPKIVDLQVLMEDEGYAKHVANLSLDQLIQGVVTTKVKKTRGINYKNWVLTSLKGRGWVNSRDLAQMRRDAGLTSDIKFYDTMRRLTEQGLVERRGERQQTDYKLTKRGGCYVRGM